MNQPIGRRVFLMGAGAMAAGLATARSARAARRSDLLNIGVIGVGGQGGYSIANVRNENVVALCDVDSNTLGRVAAEFPGAKTYSDFRKMIDAGGLDAVCVCTPDHTHAVATAYALRAGLHVYCEKPLTHNVTETRTVARLAREMKRVTQMGTQIHAGSNYRRVVELVRSGAIGPIAEVHVFVGGGYSGGERPTDTPPVPPNLNWDLWLGPAPYRPYSPVYAPFAWRGWWAFGGGTLADMACHHVDLPKWALELGAPTHIEAEGPPVHPESTPTWLIVRYDFPARKDQPAVRLTWYNGDKRPSYFAEGKLPAWGNGTLFVGQKGMILADYDRHVLLPEKDFAGFTPPPHSIPDSIGQHAEWLNAIRTGGVTLCNFDYAGELTETVLLGNVAYRTGQPIDWDSRKFRVTNCPEAAHFLREPYRKGWKL